MSERRNLAGCLAVVVGLVAGLGAAAAYTFIVTGGDPIGTPAEGTENAPNLWTVLGIGGFVGYAAGSGVLRLAEWRKRRRH